MVKMVIRSCAASVLSAVYLSLAPAAWGQQSTTESLTVAAIAPDAPAWLGELAAADDYREPADSDALDSRPYAEAGITPSSPAIPGFTSSDPATNAVPVGYQAKGALSGKVVFAMAGHGWTYDPDEMYYYTQRGLSHGMVEDMGNADQMHIFAHLVFNAGATVVPLKPIDHQPNERILDNTMQQVKFFGDWRAGSSDRFFGEPDDTIPYAVTAASLTESALARYRPYIPETGYYPVYVWARDGADRSNQLYRVRHSGGITEVRVNWRQVGKAWVWLGTYHFEQGDAGHVDISNQVVDPYEAYGNNVVVADAVRFGNGRGDVPRPGGLSGFTREDEGDNYWIERSLGVGADRRLFDIGRDASSTVASPPKAAAHINRENFGAYLDRTLISFHSNAATGKARGTVALYNASAHRRPTFQESLAEIVGNELNVQMRYERPPAEHAWADRERNTYSGINFGELRRDYVQNEMAATIVESAFHDNAEDVTFLMDPRSRINMSAATLRGMLMWEASISSPKATSTMPPAAPAGIAATIKEGKIQVKWKAGPVGRFEGGAADNFRIYRSVNGYGFDGGQAFGAATELITLNPLTTGGVTFLRVTAMNAAGESLPSQTIAVRPSFSANGKPAARAGNLMLAANTVIDSSTNIPYALDSQPGGGAYRPGATTRRVRAIFTMMEPSGAAEALALAQNGVGFDGADTAGFEAGLLDSQGYGRIILTTEQQQPRENLFSAPLLNQLRSYLGRGGKLYVSGSGVTDNLWNSGRAGRSFLTDSLGITRVSPQRPRSSMVSLDNRFLPTTATVGLLAQNRPWAAAKEITPAVFEINQTRSLGLLKYPAPDSKGFAAALTRASGAGGEVIVLGFPLSLIEKDGDRTAIMAAILKQL